MIDPHGGCVSADHADTSVFALCASAAFEGLGNALLGMPHQAFVAHASLARRETSDTGRAAVWHPRCDWIPLPIPIPGTGDRNDRFEQRCGLCRTNAALSATPA